MSIIRSLVLVLLCFSYHACNARTLGVAHNDPAEEFHYPTSKKNDGKLNTVSVSIKPEGRSPAAGEVENGVHGEPGKDLATGSGSGKGSVSWRVPGKKRGEQDPGFNLDYLPPKTHPPVHN